MTTRVLVANYGPQMVKVMVMNKGAEGPEAGMVGPDTVAREQRVSGGQEMSEYVHSSQYLVLKEITPA